MKKVVSVFLGKLAISVSSIVLLRVYSDNLSLAEIGLITLLINFETFFGFVFSSSLGNHLALTALSDFRDKILNQKMYDYLVLNLIAGVCSIVLFVLYLHFFEVELGVLVALLFILYVFLNHSTPIVPSLLTVINKTESSIILQVIKSLSSLISFILLFKIFKGVSGWVLASLVGTIVPTVVNMIYFKKVFSFKGINLFRFWNFWKKDAWLKFIIPFAVLQLVLWFFFNAYRIYAGKLFELEFLGKLGLAFTFSTQFCFAFDTVITQIYQSDFYRLIDDPSKEKRLENFGLFLNKTQPVYLLFFILGFIPFVLSFQLLLKPNFQVDIIFLLFAWVFSFLRISFNLFGLITLVLSNPRIVMRLVFSGVCLSLIGFGLLLFFKSAISERLFLISLVILSFLVLYTLIYQVSKWINRNDLMHPFLGGLILFLVVVFILPNAGEIFVVIEDNMMLLVMVSIVLLALVGIRILALPKKLKEI